MVRLLIIGRPARELADDIDASTCEAVAVEAARRPAAGVRHFESTPADLIVVTDDADTDRVQSLADAIRQRPLGKLVPMIAVAPADDTGDRIRQLELVDWHGPDTPTATIVATIEEALETSIRDDQSASGDAATTRQTDDPVAPEAAAPDGSASYLDGDVVLEPVDEPDRPRRLDRDSLFDDDGPAAPDGSDVTADELDRKLETVRHDDYYAILEVRRGAESQSVRDAFHRLYNRYDPDSMRFDLVRDRREAIDEIRDALEDAFAVLGDPELRRRYLDHTTQ